MKLTKQFSKRLLEQFDNNKEAALNYINSIKRTSIFPLQKVSELMTETTQVSFNIEEKGIRLIDPFNLVKSDREFFENNYE